MELEGSSSASPRPSPALAVLLLLPPQANRRRAASFLPSRQRPAASPPAVGAVLPPEPSCHHVPLRSDVFSLLDHPHQGCSRCFWSDRCEGSPSARGFFFPRKPSLVLRRPRCVSRRPRPVRPVPRHRSPLPHRRTPDPPVPLRSRVLVLWSLSASGAVALGARPAKERRAPAPAPLPLRGLRWQNCHGFRPFLLLDGCVPLLSLSDSHHLSPSRALWWTSQRGEEQGAWVVASPARTALSCRGPLTVATPQQWKRREVRAGPVAEEPAIVNPYACLFYRYVCLPTRRAQ